MYKCACAHDKPKEKDWERERVRFKTLILFSCERCSPLSDHTAASECIVGP